MTAAYLISGAGVLGGVIASYVVTTAWRATEPNAPDGGRSACDGCGRALSLLETVPLVSFAFAQGRCRACSHRITVIHPAGEAAGILSGAAIAAAAPDWRASFLALMAAALLGASVVDAKTRKLPDLLTLLVAVCAVALAAGRGLSALVEGGLVATASAGLFFLLRWNFSKARGEVGLGLGDVKLFCALAVWLGISTPWMILLASGLGLAAAALIRSEDRKIAFGPMIAIAGFGLGLIREAGLWPTGL